MYKYVVTLHRTYEIPEEEVRRRYEELDEMYSRDEVASRIAMDLMAVESEGYEDFSDFVSATVEKIKTD